MVNQHHELKEGLSEMRNLLQKARSLARENRVLAQQARLARDVSSTGRNRADSISGS